MDKADNTARELFADHVSIVMGRFDIALEQSGFDAAVGHMAWAVVFYLVVQLLALVFARDSVSEAGLRVG